MLTPTRVWVTLFVTVLVVGLGVADDVYGTVKFTGRGTNPSAATVHSLAVNYRFVTTAVNNSFPAAGTTAAAALGAVADRTVNYAVIDDLQAADLPASTVAIPFFGATIVLPFKLSSVGANVSKTNQVIALNTNTLALIFAGTITQWSDPRIVALNPNTSYAYASQLAASSQSIQVVVRSDASPVTRAFTRTLATVSSAFAQTVGASDQPNWPSSFTQVVGAANVLQTVSSTEGAIGFVDLPSWLATSGAPAYTALVNNLGARVAMPSTASVQRLMYDSAKTFKANNSMVGTLSPAANVTTSWPLGWMSYLVSPTTNFTSCAIPKDLFQWYVWTQSNAQAMASLSDAGYAALHYAVLKRATDAMGGVFCNNTRSVPTSLLSGAGGTLPQIAYQAWIQEYATNVASSFMMNYTGVGSSTGIADSQAYNSDLGASDAALTPTNYGATGGADLQMLPAIAAAVVMVYNLPEVPSSTPIMFTREILPLIYLGNITMWNDPRIAAANPSLALPNASIIIVGRSDGSGTTSVFTQALSLFSPIFNQSVGAVQLVNWGPDPITGMNAVPLGFIPSNRYKRGSGNGEVVSIIKQTNYSLGYAVSADVLGTGLPFATMRNKAGFNVSANATTINAALVEFADAFTANFSAIVQDGASSDVWPMATYSYLLIHYSTMTECSKATSLLDFIIWSQSYSRPIEIAESLGYTVTPIAVRRRFLTTLAGVTCKGTTVFSLVPCLKDGVVCSDHGTCLDGACVCQSGYYGSQCADTLGSSSSDTLAIALGVALPVGFFVLCCLVAIFVLFGFLYWRKGRQQELLMAEEWSDYSGESLEMSDFSSNSNSNSSTRSRPGLTMSRDLSFTDLEQLQLSYEPKALMFGLGATDKCPIDEELHDEILITNTGSTSRKFAFFVPAEDETLRCKLHPGMGVVKAGKSVTVHVSCTLLMTTIVERKIKFEVEGLGRHLISIKLIGEISPKLDPNDIVTIPPPIGVGSFGSVYKADYRGQEVAAKILNSQMHAKQIEEFKREVGILQRLRSPYVLNFIGASHVEGKRCIVTELCTHGSVADLVFSEDTFNYNLMLKVALDMSKAISFLHGNGVLHRDIKPENFLMVSRSAKSPVCCKIADFGTSRSMTTVRELLNHTAALGTPLYMAPEVLEHKAYSAKIDVYSFGVVLWVLYTRREPYTELKRQWDVPRFVIKGKRPSIPHHCPKAFGDLISQCWAHNPDDRPDMVDVVKVIERLFEDERGGSRLKSQTGTDAARDRDLAPDAEGNRERKGMRTWEGGKNLLMVGQGGSSSSGSEEEEGTEKRKSKRKSRGIFS